MSRRHVSDTPQYKNLLNCAHVTGAKHSLEYTRKPNMTAKDLPELAHILTITCDIPLDAADPKYSGEDMLLIASAIYNLMVYAETDRHFDKVIVTN